MSTYILNSGAIQIRLWFSGPRGLMAQADLEGLPIHQKGWNWLTVKSEGKMFCEAGAMAKNPASLDPTNCSFFLLLVTWRYNMLWKKITLPYPLSFIVFPLFGYFNDRSIARTWIWRELRWLGGRNLYYRPTSQRTHLPLSFSLKLVS